MLGVINGAPNLHKIGLYFTLINLIDNYFYSYLTAKVTILGYVSQKMLHHLPIANHQISL